MQRRSHLPFSRRAGLGFAEQAAILVGRHVGHDFRRERDALPEAVEGGSLGEVATIQDNQVAVDQVEDDRVRDSFLKRLVEGFLGTCEPSLHYMLNRSIMLKRSTRATWSVAALRSARVPVCAARSSRPIACSSGADFCHGAKSVGEQLGRVVERAKALARLQDEHAGEGPAPVHHSGGEDGRRGLRVRARPW